MSGEKQVGEKRAGGSAYRRVGVILDPRIVLVLVLVLDRLPLFDRGIRRGADMFPTRRHANTPTRQPVPL
jgi:hypothetical protein